MHVPKYRVCRSYQYVFTYIYMYTYIQINTHVYIHMYICKEIHRFDHVMRQQPLSHCTAQVFFCCVVYEKLVVFGRWRLGGGDLNLFTTGRD